jgi:proliferating cell nuclear antigen
MNQLGEKLDVEITSSGTDLIFRCEGDFAEQETIITENNGSIKVQRDPDAINNIIQGVFLLKHLVLFTKCTNLCQNVQLYLKNDYPLILLYTVANLGEVKLMLARLKERK